MTKNENMNYSLSALYAANKGTVKPYDFIKSHNITPDKLYIRKGRILSTFKVIDTYRKVIKGEHKSINNIFFGITLGVITFSLIGIIIAMAPPKAWEETMKPRR